MVSVKVLDFVKSGGPGTTMKQGGWRRRPRPRRARLWTGPRPWPGCESGACWQGGWPWWPGWPWRAPGASEAGGRDSGGTGLPRTDSGPTLENRSTGRTGPSFAPAEASKRDSRLERAQPAWTRAAPIPADPEHPARRWMARRHRWRPDLELPPSVRWLPAGSWRWHNGQMAGAIVAAFGRPNEGQLSGVQLIHVDAEGRAVLDRPEAAGALKSATTAIQRARPASWGCRPARRASTSPRAWPTP